ncbi:MAG TPA: M23 family metallopeptidase [Gemmatimonadales bacterium]|jgi:murein DD-endopeptidase MepM/ murein hydrolase activator NlpD|nr:M23 family metallopeptidase [Gemmatimonadales bacterium]
MLRRRPKVTLALLALLVAGLWTVLRAGESLPLAAPIVVEAPFRDLADTLRRNETLSHLFGRHAIEGPELLAVLSAAPSIKPRRTPAGQVFEFRYHGRERRPARVRVRVSADELLWLRRSPDGAWRGEVERINWAPAPVRIVGTVRSSLYETLWGLIPDSVLDDTQRGHLIDDLTDGVFGWQIDFTRDLREGDQFRILFERLTSDLGERRYGRLLAARLEIRGRQNTAFVLPDDNGRNAYYDETGLSLRRAFKISPVRYTRLTSRFSASRFHPVLRTWRAHLGEDYRAPVGTPVSATADGTVIRAGRWGGYGIMVGIRHAKGIETRYAHLSSIAGGISVGTRVKQGDVIGRSGMTGLANAPHVHYEFLKNGGHRNPRSVDRGDGTPVPASRNAEFESVRYHYGRLLDNPTPRIPAPGPT